MQRFQINFYMLFQIDLKIDFRLENFDRVDVSDFNENH